MSLVDSFDTSLFTVLPQDIIQNILSFNALSRVQPIVCKEWKLLCHNNTNTAIYKRNKTALEETTKQQVEMNQNGKKWMIDLTTNLTDALNKCNSGDILIIDDGSYTISDNKINKEISLIGVGEHVQIVFGDEEDESFFWDDGFIFSNNTHLKNISIKTVTRFELESAASVWIEDCTVYTLFCKGGGSLYAKNCTFLGGPAIDIDVTKTYDPIVEIMGCYFIECGRYKTEDPPENTVYFISTYKQDIGCIAIYDHNESDICSISYLKIVGNVFENSNGRPIVYTFNEDKNDDTKQKACDEFLKNNDVRIKDNVSENERIIHDKWVKSDPNKIHLGFHRY